MDEKLPALIQALLEPGRYPGSVTNVELIETHASWVLLAGEYAYKIKKTVVLPFLDYGTLVKRKDCCEAELRLNRRFTPELYLGLVEITGSPQQPRLGELGVITGDAIEYAVKMQRFDEAARLDRVCSRGELTTGHITQLVEAVAQFHASTSLADAKTDFGSPSKILAPALENLEYLQAHLTQPGEVATITHLIDWTHAEFERLRQQFTQRKATGCIRECHGDLHLANLVLINGKVKLFDCIEFNEDFRWIDIANEISFTYVDLFDHKQPALAGWLLNEWLNTTGDYGAVSLVHFYSVYRAMVRAKVAAIRAEQTQGSSALVGEYLALAQQLTQPPTPCLTITYGLSGSGKTTAARARLLADKNGATLCLRSDIERKRLYGLAGNSKSDSPLNEGIYSAEANLRTYQRLYDLSAQLLAEGWSVIVDAAFLKHEERTKFKNLATTMAFEFYILVPQASPQQLIARINARLAQGQDASEATPSVLQHQQALIELLDATELACVTQV